MNHPFGSDHSFVPVRPWVDDRPVFRATAAAMAPALVPNAGAARPTTTTSAIDPAGETLLVPTSTSTPVTEALRSAFAT